MSDTTEPASSEQEGRTEESDEPQRPKVVKQATGVKDAQPASIKETKKVIDEVARSSVKDTVQNIKDTAPPTALAPPAPLSPPVKSPDQGRQTVQHAETTPSTSSRAAAETPISQRASRKAQREEPAAQPVTTEGEGSELVLSDDTDSIDDRFADYSETVRDEMRTLDKGAWDYSDPSLDPTDCIDDYITYQMPLPPKNYDALQEAAALELEELDDLKDAEFTPEAKKRIQYRRQLMEGTSLEDQRWLKLRAYHRAAEKLRAGRAAAQAGRAREQELWDAGVPLDVVPQQLFDMPAHKVVERRGQLQALVDKPTRTEQIRQTLQQFGPYSDDSEWDMRASLLGADGLDVRYGLQYDADARTAVADGLRLALSPSKRDGEDVTGGTDDQAIEHPSTMAAAAAAAAPFDATATGRSAEPGRVGPREAAAAEEEEVWRTVYTPEYIDYVIKMDKQRVQERQRSQAFWFALATVGGLSLWRLVRRVRRGVGGKGAGKGSKKAAEAVPPLA